METLERIYQKYDDDGVGELLHLDEETFEGIEIECNEKISTTTDEIEFKQWVQVRYMFRILRKFSQDINRGKTALCNIFNP